MSPIRMIVANLATAVEGAFHGGVGPLHSLTMLCSINLFSWRLIPFALLTLGFNDVMNCNKVAANQGFFLGTGPTFDLPFKQKCLMLCLNFLRPDQLNRPARCGVTLVAPFIMLCPPMLKIAGHAGVISPIGTTQNINEGHGVSMTWKCFAGVMPPNSP